MRDGPVSAGVARQGETGYRNQRGRELWDSILKQSRHLEPETGSWAAPLTCHHGGKVETGGQERRS